VRHRLHGCNCRRSQPLGLDELMIVNPAPPDDLLMGDDGTVYQVHGLGGSERRQGFGRLFLGEDGTVYEVVPP